MTTESHQVKQQLFRSSTRFLPRLRSTAMASVPLEFPANVVPLYSTLISWASHPLMLLTPENTHLSKPPSLNGPDMLLTAQLGCSLRSCQSPFWVLEKACHKSSFPAAHVHVAARSVTPRLSRRSNHDIRLRYKPVEERIVPNH